MTDVHSDYPKAKDADRLSNGSEKQALSGALDKQPVVIAIASGKGGTGKTTIAVNLAKFAAAQGNLVTYVDCDVEEPNGHIFLKPVLEYSRAAYVSVPIIDESTCLACGKCKEICQFNAIAVFGDKAIAFPNLCHSCGGCMLVCPTSSISEGRREIGLVEVGLSGDLRFIHGRLQVGQAISPPLIRQVRDAVSQGGLVFIDCPPGTSCPVIQSVRGSDYVLLVTEPTPFGLHDLKLAVEMLRELNLPFGVVINRSGARFDKLSDYCDSEKINILMDFPDSREAAEAYSRGLLLADVLPEFGIRYAELLGKIPLVKEESVCS